MHVPSYGENIWLKHAEIEINFKLGFKGLMGNNYIDYVMSLRMYQNLILVLNFLYIPRATT